MRMSKKNKNALINAIETINAGNREEERELSFLLAPIDRRLTVKIFNKGEFDYEAAVGYDGLVNYKPGIRFRFGVNPKNLRPYVVNEEFFFDFADNAEFALECLRQETACTLWNYFHHRNDRVLQAVDPLAVNKKQNS